MKTSLSLALALLLPLAAHARNITLDVSGRGGSGGRGGADGSSGSSGGWGWSTQGGHGRDGDDGTDGEDGQPGGVVDVEVGFVPGSNGREVYVRGTVQRPRGGTERIDMRAPTEDLQRLEFLANGGAGGSGGAGGDGGRGGSGGNGSSPSGYGNGSDGGDGGNGGRGGGGGRGGDGGDAGRVRVRLAAGAELLGPLVRIQAEPGSAGSGGRAGDGGSGGSGGWGNAGCTSYRRNDGTTEERCGSSGSWGRSGSSGSSGRQGSAGRQGASARPEFLNADERPIRGVYQIQTVRFLFDEATVDGVVEHGERLRVTGVVLRNSGQGPAPAARHTVALANGESREVQVKALAPGEEVTVPIQPPAQYTARDGMTGFPYSLRMDHVNVATEAPRQFVTQQPVQLRSATSETLTTTQRDGSLRLTIQNVASRTYGATGQVPRSVRVRLEPEGGTNPVFVQINGRFERLDRPREVEIPVIEAGRTVVLDLPVRAPANWRPGKETNIRASLLVQGAERTAQARVNTQLILDPNGPIERDARVMEDNVFCRRSWHFFRNQIEGVSMRKLPNQEQVVVTIRLKGRRNASPNYTINLSQVPRNFRERLLREETINPSNWVDFLLAHAPSQSFFSMWKIKNCVVRENPNAPPRSQAPRTREDDEADLSDAAGEVLNALHAPLTQPGDTSVNLGRGAKPAGAPAGAEPAARGPGEEGGVQRAD